MSNFNSTIIDSIDFLDVYLEKKKERHIYLLWEKSTGTGMSLKPLAVNEERTSFNSFNYTSNLPSSPFGQFFLCLMLRVKGALGILWLNNHLSGAIYMSFHLLILMIDDLFVWGKSVTIANKLWIIFYLSYLLELLMLEGINCLNLLSIRLLYLRSFSAISI